MNLSLISKKLKQFPILFVCGVLIPLSVVLFFMRGPKISHFENELTRLEGEWNRIQENRERSAGLEDDIGLLDEGLSVVQRRLMNVDEVASNYEFFYGLESATGVNLVQFSQGNASDGADLALNRDELKHFSVIPYDVVMSGSLQELLSFMDLLDRQEFIVRFDLVNVYKQNDESPESEILMARMRCHVLAMKNE